MYVAKTRARISCTITARLICAFVFAYAKSRFSHDKAHFGYGNYFFFPFFLKLMPGIAFICQEGK